MRWRFIGRLLVPAYPKIDVESTHLLGPTLTHTRKLLEQNPAFVMIEVGAEKMDGPLMGNRQVHRIQTPAAWRDFVFHEALSIVSFSTA